MTMLDFSVLADETPQWAAECFLCVPDELGSYNEAMHLHSHQPMTCDCCGEIVPHRLHYEMNHGANPKMHHPYSITIDLCMSAWLRLNHLRYDITHGQLPAARDLLVLEQLNLLVTPEGDFVPRSPISETGA